MAEGLAITLRQSAPIPLDFRLVVPKGSTTALVGPSGGGKTTILRCIAGLHEPAHGEVAAGESRWLDTAMGLRVPAPARRVGMVFQSYALFPHRTAAQNVMEAMLDRPRARRHQRALELLAQVRLDDLADRYPAELSGGQQQRVALARALARDPQVLLLDEPFSAVDHPTRRALHAALATVRAASDMPILIVSHDIADAARVADTLCLVDRGRAVETGPAQDLLADAGSALSRWMNGPLPQVAT